MPKNNKPSIVKDISCLNCGFPFSGQENFCPECGQKNKGDKLTFGSFISEIFNGFISWDAKFWTTIIPLLTKPGKVSLDYIEGKRNRYTNPFRFYLTVSILFFLIIGLNSSYTSFKNLNNASSEKSTKKEINLDSIQNIVLDGIEESKPDSIIQKDKKSKNDFNLTIGGSDNIGSFLKFQKKHPKIKIDDALDSLKAEKTFTNRLWYSRAEALNGLRGKGERKKFLNEIIGEISIALFILLPIFTLFLKLIYIRRKKIYVEHLVFVFHTQTVFFLLLIIFYLINFIKNSEDI